MANSRTGLVLTPNQQTLTEEQKEQARNNINAATPEMVAEASSSTKNKIDALNVPTILFPRNIYANSSGNRLALTTNQSFILVYGNVAHFYLKFRYNAGFAVAAASTVYQTPIVPFWTANASAYGYGTAVHHISSTTAFGEVFLDPDGKIIFRNNSGSSGNKATQEIDAYFAAPILRIDKSLVAAETSKKTLDEAYYDWTVEGAAELCVPFMDTPTDDGGHGTSAGIDGVSVANGTAAATPATGPFNIDELIEMSTESEMESFYWDVRDFLIEKGKINSGT